MQVYSVHLRRQGQDLDQDIVLIKEGINWSALLFTSVWALWHRLWWVAFALFAASAAIGGALAGLGADEFTLALFNMAVAIVAALLANDLRRDALANEGYEDAGVVCGPDPDAALFGFMQANPGLLEDA